jgi:hypothetical protein
MKYIISESQSNRIYPKYADSLKKPMFLYWDKNGGKDISTAMKLFSIPPGGSSLVEEWLLEWMGGEDLLMKKLNEYTKKVFRGQAGSYDFKFFLTNPRIYSHGGVEIYFDATVDGEGKVEIFNKPEIVNVYQASSDDDIGWEVEDEIRDTIFERLEEVVDKNIPFGINIDMLRIKQPKNFPKV